MARHLVAARGRRRARTIARAARDAVGSRRLCAASVATLERAAASDATEGETGTGKDAAAESIHREGVRRDGPFVERTYLARMLEFHHDNVAAAAGAAAVDRVHLHRLLSRAGLR